MAASRKHKLDMFQRSLCFTGQSLRQRMMGDVGVFRGCIFLQTLNAAACCHKPFCTVSLLTAVQLTVGHRGAVQVIALDFILRSACLVRLVTLHFYSPLQGVGEQRSGGKRKQQKRRFCGS